MKPNQKLTRPEWRKTPYADTEATAPDTAILKLLTARGIKDIQPTYTTGVNGRPFYSIRFKHGEKVYVVGLENLNCPEVKPEQLSRQAQRAIYYMLKSMLEFATVFAHVEQVLFPWIEVGAPGSGQTLYDAMAPNLDKLNAAGFTGSAVAAITAGKGAADAGHKS